MCMHMNSVVLVFLCNDELILQQLCYMASVVTVHFSVCYLLADKVQEAMTAEEKEKLYAAIGYQESGAAAIYPKEVEPSLITFYTSSKGGCTVEIRLDKTKNKPERSLSRWINFVLSQPFAQL